MAHLATGLQILYRMFIHLFIHLTGSHTLSIQSPMLSVVGIKKKKSFNTKKQLVLYYHWLRES